MCIRRCFTLLTVETLVLAAALAPPAGSAQAPSLAAQDEQRRLVESIDDIRAREGAYSAQLLGPFTALAELYRESGDDKLAAAAVEQALQIVRANFGLYSLKQAPLLQEQILNDEANGDASSAWKRQQELLALVNRHPTDLRTVPILREMGAKRMSVLTRYLAGEFPAEITLGCYFDPIPYDDIGSCYSGSKRVVVSAILDDAWSHYFDAINVLQRNRLYASDELRDLEMELVRSSYAHEVYGVGRASLRRLFSYEVRSGAPRLRQLDALVQLADWDLLFVSNRGAPLDLYAFVYEQLKREETGREAIARVFSPDLPVVLPAFLPNPLARDETSQPSGYIDIAFEITKFGESRAIDVVGASDDATSEAKQRLVRLVARSRFRPRVTYGELRRSERLLVRYYLND